MRFLLNEHADRVAASGLRGSPRQPLAFHRQLDGYRPTPLHDLPELASELGLERLWLKDETCRFDLPAFKILGASWALRQALAARLDCEPDPETDLFELAQRCTAGQPLVLVSATDGNHGRAVARLAGMLGLEAEIHIPGDMVEARRADLRSEQAHVIVVDGTYDDAVVSAASQASETKLVISDTSWPGYERIPSAIIDGYATILWEIEADLQRLGETGPDLVVVQVGVGALATAVISHYRRAGLESAPVLIAVEPVDADCALQTLQAGHPVTVAGPHRSVMAGLNAGNVSLLAVQPLLLGLDGCVAVSDDLADEAVDLLARYGLRVGESGAAGLAGLLALRQCPAEPLSTVASAARRALIIATEGVTDPQRRRPTAPAEELLTHPHSTQVA